MAKTLSPRQWVHYVHLAKERGCTSIAQAYEKPSAKMIDTLWHLTACADYARIVPLDSLDFVVFRRVMHGTCPRYVIDTHGECYSLNKEALLRLLESEHEPLLMLYILDIEATC